MKRKRLPGIIRSEPDELKKLQLAITGQPLTMLESAVLSFRNPPDPAAYTKEFCEWHAHTVRQILLDQFLDVISKADTATLRRLADLLDSPNSATFADAHRAKLHHWKFLLGGEAVSIDQVKEMMQYTGNIDVLRRDAKEAGINLVDKPFRHTSATNKTENGS